ncbi:unnamed protein product [Calypogeia fissa]
MADFDLALGAARSQSPLGKSSRIISHDGDGAFLADDEKQEGDRARVNMDWWGPVVILHEKAVAVCASELTAIGEAIGMEAMGNGAWGIRVITHGNADEIDGR